MKYDEFKIITSDILKSDMRENGDHKQYFITGVMSGPELDLVGDIVTKSGLESMVEAINGGIIGQHGDLQYVPLRSGHGKREWEYEIGWFTKAWLDNDMNMWVEAELDPLSNRAMELWNRLQRTTDDPMKSPKKLGFSIGGKAARARKVFDATVNKTIRYLDEIRLFEGVITSQPVYYPSFAEVIMKSVNWEEIPTEDTMTKEETLETLVTTEESETVAKSTE